MLAKKELPSPKQFLLFFIFLFPQSTIEVGLLEKMQGVLVRTRETPRRFPYASLLRAKTEVRLAYHLRLFLAGEKPPAFAPQNRKSSPARICFAKSREDAEKARRRRSSLRRAAFEVATRETLGVSLTTFPCGRKSTARICSAKSEKLNASRRRFFRR